MNKLAKKKALTSFVALVIGLGLPLYTGLWKPVGGLYSEHLPLRWQVESFLKGQLALSTSPRGLGWDLAWHNGKVQQVFGLAVPVWQLLFEAPVRLLGLGPFPDRICFIVALVLVTYWIVNTQRSDQFDLGLVYLGLLCTVLFPPFIALCSSRFLAYEEIVAYGYIGALALAFGIVRWINAVADQQINRDAVTGQLTKLEWGYIGVCAGSGLMPFIRPTFGAYGLVAFGLTTIIARLKRLNRWVILGGIIIYVGLTGLLLWLNYYRFGAPLEFGHSLNLNSIAAMRYASRFDHPYQDEPIGSAARELISALFFTKSFGIPARSGYEPDLFPGQSPTLRWREIYFTTFGVNEFLTTTVVWVGATAWFIVHRRRALTEPGVVLGLWSLLSGLMLFWFYLRFPFLSSRYLLDFGPGIAIGAWVFWTTAMRYVSRVNHLVPIPALVVIGALIFWWGSSATRIWTRESSNTLTLSELRERMAQEKKRSLDVELPLEYTNAIQRARIPFNLDGWLEDGTTLASVAAFVKDPECLVLDLTSAGDTPLPKEAYEDVRAKIGLEFLKRQSITPIDKGWRIVFAGPTRSQYKNGYQVAFIALVKRAELTTGKSPFRLLRIAWRKDRVLWSGTEASSEARASEVPTNGP